MMTDLGKAQPGVIVFKMAQGAVPTVIWYAGNLIWRLVNKPDKVQFLQLKELLVQVKIRFDLKTLYIYKIWRRRLKDEAKINFL